MKTSTKRGISAGVSVALVGGIIAGAALLSGNVAGATPEPEPTVSSVSFDRPAGDFDDVRPDVTPTPTPTETPEPVVEPVAPVVEEPAPAPAVPAPAPVAPVAPPAPVVEAPPAPAPPPPAVRCPAGSSATESDGYNDTACMRSTADNGGSCWEGDNGMLPECQSFRP